MKKLVTLSTVVALHLAAVSMIFIQPGCGSTDENAKDSTASASADKSTEIKSEPVNADLSTGLPSDTAAVADAHPEGSSELRATPSRPASNWNMNGGGAVIVEEQPLVSTETEAKKSSLSLEKYTVQKGDNLFKIAKAKNVAFGELLSANGFSKDTQLKVGQEIVIPSVTLGTPAVAEKKAETAAVSAPTNVGVEMETYVVQKGDSLSKIASKNSTTVAQIKAANNLTSDNIRIGQKLSLPKGGAATAPARAEASAASAKPSTVATTATAAGPALTLAAGETEYVIQSGDVLGSIAKKNGTTVAKITERNSIKDPRKIRVGQKIVIPAASAAKAAAAATPKADAASKAPEAKTPEAPAAPKEQPIETITVEGMNAPAPDAKTAPAQPKQEEIQVIEVQ